MNVLIVVAHPDDEVLGVGGTAYLLAQKGYKITSCILCHKADARKKKPKHNDLIKNIYKAQEILGLEKPILGSFSNIKFNSIPQIELVQFIEEAIKGTNAQIIFTHHPCDINIDHYYTSIACQAAARLFQRTNLVPRLIGLYYMEVLSSTDWAFPGTRILFEPDTFVEIGEALEKKIEAIKAYNGVLRQFPHSRSEEAIRALAAIRGAQSGLTYAEAFQLAFQINNF